MKDIFSLEKIKFYDYKEPREEKSKNIEDCLTIGVDFDSRTNYGVVTVGRHKNGKLYIINVLENDEARELYNKLIGVKNE